MADLLSFDGTPGVHVDLDRLITGRMLLQANSGGGKSRALRYLLEQTHGKVQQIVLDWEGEFESLREKFDYLLVGEGGDIPVNPRTARTLARRLLELRTSAVIDLYSLDVEKRREYVKFFLEALMHLPKDLWHPCLIVIDEAHLLCPEKGSAVSKDAVIALATQGRKRGFAICAATQRIAKFHKDCAAELLNKLIGRTGLDVDLVRAGDELGFNKEQREQLKWLEPGEFYTYGPAISREVVKIRTGDILTTHPEPGAVAPPTPPPTANILSLLQKMEDLDQAAETEAKSLEDAKREIARLNTEIRRTKRAPTAEELEASVKARTEALTSQIAQLREQVNAAPSEAAIAREVALAIAPLEERNGHLEWLQNEVWEIVQRLAAIFRIEGLKKEELEDKRSLEIPAELKIAKTVLAPVARRAPVETVLAKGISGPQQRILNALLTLERVGLLEPERSHVALYADASPNSSAYSNNVSRLNVLGLLRYPSQGRLTLTESGRDIAEADDAPATIEGLHDRWCSLLSGPQQAILRVLIAHYPLSVARSNIAAETGASMTSSAFANNVSRLSSLGLARYPDKGLVIASDLLFPEGLR